MKTQTQPWPKSRLGSISVKQKLVHVDLYLLGVLKHAIETLNRSLDNIHVYVTTATQKY